MDRPHLFQHFDTLADQLEAASKLRSLVLQLAVAGRLVAQEECDVTWQLEIPNEKRRTIESLRLTRHPETSPSAQDELPYIMPKQWLGTRLGDLAYSCPTAYGENPSPGLRAAGVITVGNINNAGGFKGHFTQRGFPPEEIEELLAHKGDLIVVKSSGSAENVHSGKSALCRAEHHRKIVGSNFVMRLRTFGKSALPEFVWIVLTSRTSRAWVERTVQTMTYPNLKWSEYAQLPIGLPPLGEQRRIVSKVEELLALCEQLEARQTTVRERRTCLVRSALNHLATAKDEQTFQKHSAFILHPSSPILDSVPALRQAIFSLAVQGRLVAQNPKDEPVTAQLSRIDKAKAKLLSKAGIRRTATFPEVLPSEAPYQIPANWKWARVGVVGMAQTGSTPPTAEPRFFGDFIPFVKPADLTNREINYQGEGISESGIEKSSLIASGSVLMVCIGGSIGKTNLNTKDVCCNQQINALTPFADTDSRYIMICMRSAWFQDKVKEDAGQTTLPIISKGKWEQLPIPIPPVPEQQRIVAKVDELMYWCDALEGRLAASQTTATHLLDAALNQVLVSNGHE